jgi:hypothetical protein
VGEETQILVRRESLVQGLYVHVGYATLFGNYLGKHKIVSVL